MVRWPSRKDETRRSNARWSRDELDELHRRGWAEPVPLVDGRMPSDRWPELAQFFGAYLHQDYDLDGTVDECVAQAIADQDAAGLTEVEANLRELLAREWREEQLYAALSDLGCAVAPYADDLTYSEWLESIRDRVAHTRWRGPAAFTASHRGGSGPPLVLLHGFLDTWRTWELVLRPLEREHDVLALTLPGHAGGPPVDADVTPDRVVDAVERALDDAGFATAHLAGNSLGGYVALKLAERGRAQSVVAFAPAGGWAEGDESFRDLLALQRATHAALQAVAPQADAIVATPAGRRRVAQLVATNVEHIPPELLAHQVVAAAAAPGADALVEGALRHGWSLEPERIVCPVRIVWGTEDRLLPWPAAAARYFADWLPHVDWVVLDGVGHAPQLDVPLEAAELLLDFSR